jgi:hypothetical protein
MKNTAQDDINNLCVRLARLEQAVSHLTEKTNHVEARAAHDKANGAVVQTAMKQRIEDAVEALNRAMAQHTATNDLLSTVAGTLRNA